MSEIFSGLTKYISDKRRPCACSGSAQEYFNRKEKSQLMQILIPDLLQCLARSSSGELENTNAVHKYSETHIPCCWKSAAPLASWFNRLERKLQNEYTSERRCYHCPCFLHLAGWQVVHTALSASQMMTFQKTFKNLIFFSPFTIWL